jgi:hypothetical protein
VVVRQVVAEAVEVAEVGKKKFKIVGCEADDFVYGALTFFGFSITVSGPGYLWGL